MSELIPLEQINLSEYAIPSTLYSASKDMECYVDVFYLTDLHLEYYIEQGEDIENKVKSIVYNLRKHYVSSYNSIIYIGGDVADSFHLAEVFYRQLRNKYPRVHIIAVLGNHEISEFSTLEEAIAKYDSLFKELHIAFLQNKSGRFNVGFGSYSRTIACVGGIGFAPYNDLYNSDNIVVSKDIQFNREKEIEESHKFLQEYLRVLEKTAEDNSRVLVFTHYPIEDWLPESAVNSRCVYFNGHNHSNNYYFKDEAVIVADNQIGYKAESIRFKSFTVGPLYNPFFNYSDGFYEIRVKDYYDFYRFNGISLSGEGRAITKRIDDGSHFYMIKKHGYYMFLVLGGKNPLLCVGGQLKSIVGASNIEYYYNAFDTMIKRYIQMFASTYTGMKSISAKIKRFGFSGRVHGFIIDLDFYNHIMVNPFDGKLTYYYSPVFGQAQEYPSLKKLLINMKKDIKSNDYTTEKEYLREINRLDKAIHELRIAEQKRLGDGTDNQLESAKQPVQAVNVGHGSMYDYSRRMYQIQRLFDCSILREWDSSLIEGLYIDEGYKPIKQNITPYKMVKGDWRQYVQLDSQDKTKRNTLICFPIQWSDYCRSKRVFFPCNGSGDKESFEVIQAFIDSIPKDLIVDPDIVQNIVQNLSDDEFFQCFPNELISLEVLVVFMQYSKKGRLYDFPSSIMSFEKWKYIYDNYEYKSRKTRAPNFPKDVWNRLRAG